VTPTRQKLVRDLIAARKAMQDAWGAYMRAKNAYRDLEKRFIEEVPIGGRQPEAVICGETFIKAGSGWSNPESEHRLTFESAERCPTSE
jgi:hypothetical protein